MKTIEIDELKTLQLDIAEAVHDFCQAHGIKYSLACGSLLGAVRHNGYIPWDDDIDIYLPREEYEKLQRLFPKAYQGHLDFVTLETDPRWNRPYGKIHDTRTVMRERSASAIPLGVNIDVFPVDAAPDDEQEWQRYNKRRLTLQHLFEAKFVTLSRTRSIRKNIILALAKLLLLPIPTRTYARHLSRLAQRYNGTPSHHLFEACQGLFQKHPFLKVDFDSVALHPFEDRQFCIMAGYDDCLTNGFGDYMQLPPVEKRVSHHVFQAWWK